MKYQGVKNFGDSLMFHAIQWSQMKVGARWYHTWYPITIWYPIHDLVPHPQSGIPSTIWYPIHYLVTHVCLIPCLYLVPIPIWYSMHVWCPIPDKGTPWAWSLTSIWCLLLSGPITAPPPNRAPDPTFSLPLLPGTSLLIWSLSMGEFKVWDIFGDSQGYLIDGNGVASWLFWDFFHAWWRILFLHWEVEIESTWGETEMNIKTNMPAAGGGGCRGLVRLEQGPDWG